MKSLFKLFCVVMFAAASQAASYARAAPGTPPDELVKSSVNEVLTAVQQNKDKHALRQLAEQKIAPNFDFEQMTKLAVGRSWSEATPDQQKALQSAFRSLLINTYSNALAQADSTPGSGGVEVQPAHPSGNDVTVKTRVKATGKQPIAIDYHMANSADGWKVYDVAVENLSLVTTYRNSFADEIKKSGIAGLIKALQDKNQTLASS